MTTFLKNALAPIPQFLDFEFGAHGDRLVAGRVFLKSQTKTRREAAAGVPTDLEANRFLAVKPRRQLLDGLRNLTPEVLRDGTASHCRQTQSTP